jgi:hypothetical protein
LGVPLATTARTIIMYVIIQQIFHNDKKCRLKISYGCGGLGSGCYGLRYRFGNPCGFIVPHYYYFPLLNSIIIVFIFFTTATRQCRRFASLTAALRIPHAFHQLSLVAIHVKPLRGLAEFAFSYSPPSPLFEKERGDAKVVLFSYSPSLIHLERGNKKGVS